MSPQLRSVFDEHRDDLSAVARQLLQSDAIVCGDQNWIPFWNAISETIAFAKTKLSLEETGENEYRFTGLDAVIEHPSFAEIKIPSTLAAFTLSDAEPATRLLSRLESWSQSVPREELGKWQTSLTRVGGQPVVVFSYPLDEWEMNPEDFELTDDDLRSRELIQRVLADRRFHVAVGIIQSRLIFFVGEDTERLSRLTGFDLAEHQRLQHDATTPIHSPARRRNR